MDVTTFEQFILRAFLELPSVAGLVYATWVLSRQNVRLVEMIDRHCIAPRRVFGDGKEEDTELQAEVTEGRNEVEDRRKAVDEA